MARDVGHSQLVRLLATPAAIAAGDLGGEGSWGRCRLQQLTVAGRRDAPHPRLGAAGPRQQADGERRGTSMLSCAAIWGARVAGEGAGCSS
jgi:hypothetical protein